jgi:transposase
MVYYAGIDLGKRQSQVRIIGADRKVVEDLRVDNDPKEFVRIFRKYKGDVLVACEACSNAFWVADTLEPLVRKVHVGDTKKIRWIAEARIKTDKIDAGILAELLRADLFPTIAIPPRRIRDLRELVRGIVRLRRQTVRYRNQVHGLLGRHGVAYKRSAVAGPKLSELVKEAELPAPAKLAAESVLRLIDHTAAEERRLDKAIRLELKDEPELNRVVDLVETVPGVGYFSALLFVMELWDVGRFADAGRLASYIGFVPSTHQTGETLRNGRMTKQGNVLARWILVQDAWSAARTHLFFGRLYERHRKRLGKGRAIVPVARTLLSTIFRVWSEGKTYEELFGEKALVG